MEYKGNPIRFYVIYSFDIFSNDGRDVLMSVKTMQPRRSILDRLTMTEGDEQYELDYEWEFGKHRKYVGELSYDQFVKLVDDVGLRAEDVETMGSLTEMGWLPALSFDISPESYSCHLLGNAYVTPYIEGETLGDDDWDVLREQIIQEFGG